MPVSPPDLYPPADSLMILIVEGARRGLWFITVTPGVDEGVHVLKFTSQPPGLRRFLIYECLQVEPLTIREGNG